MVIFFFASSIKKQNPTHTSAVQQAYCISKKSNWSQLQSICYRAMEGEIFYLWNLLGSTRFTSKEPNAWQSCWTRWVSLDQYVVVPEGTTYNIRIASVSDCKPMTNREFCCLLASKQLSSTTCSCTRVWLRKTQTRNSGFMRPTCRYGARESSRNVSLWCWSQSQTSRAYGAASANM